MNNIRIIIIAVLTFIISMVTASPVLAQVSLPYTTDLIIDGRETVTDVGDVTMNAYGMLTFEIDEAGTAWRLAETRVYVGDEPPVKVRPDDFPYAHEGLAGEVSDVFYLDLRAFDLNGDGIVYITARAELTNPTDVNAGSKRPRITTETALIQGEESIGKGKNRTTFFAVTVSG